MRKEREETWECHTMGLTIAATKKSWNAVGRRSRTCGEGIKEDGGREATEEGSQFHLAKAS